MGTFRTTTNEKGEYRLPVVPKGEYVLTVEVSERIQGQLFGMAAATTKTSAINALLITISDASGKRGIGWDLGKNKAFDQTKDPAQQSTARTPGSKGTQYSRIGRRYSLQRGDQQGRWEDQLGR